MEEQMPQLRMLAEEALAAGRFAELAQLVERMQELQGQIAGEEKAPAQAGMSRPKTHAAIVQEWGDETSMAGTKLFTVATCSLCQRCATATPLQSQASVGSYRVI